MTEHEALSVRRADNTDVDAVREVTLQAYRMYVQRIGRQPAPMTADYDGAVKAGHTWVAELRARVVGLLVLQLAEDHMLVENVAVIPSAQGLGVGSRLLEVAEQQARVHDLSEVRLYTNEAMSESLFYYPRRGYHETHRATQDGFRRVLFTKDLA